LKRLVNCCHAKLQNGLLNVAFTLAWKAKSVNDLGATPIVV